MNPDGSDAAIIMARALMQMLPADRELAFEERMKIGGVTVDDVFPDLPVTMRLFAGKLFAQMMTAAVNHLISRPGLMKLIEIHHYRKRESE